MEIHKTGMREWVQEHCVTHGLTQIFKNAKYMLVFKTK